jgi:hypothetical protein
VTWRLPRYLNCGINCSSAVAAAGQNYLFLGEGRRHRRPKTLEQFQRFWNILVTKPSVLGVFFSAFQK